MKLYNKLSLLCIAASFSTGLLCELGTKKNPGFSLHNKSGQTILVEVQNNTGGALESAASYLASKFMVEADVVRNKMFCDKQIDISKLTSVRIYNEDKKELANATFPKNKTIYINWGGDGLSGPRIYPQRGPLKGITKQTDKGYPLNNNVKSQDIKYIK